MSPLQGGSVCLLRKPVVLTEAFKLCRNLSFLEASRQTALSWGAIEFTLPLGCAHLRAHFPTADPAAQKQRHWL